MTSITIYGGGFEVGGTKIKVKDKRTSAFLDFGESFGGHKKFYGGFSSPRSFRELWRLNLVPRVSGIYRKKFEKELGQKPHDTPSVQAVFITHSHMDHCGNVPLLDPDIPICCTRPTHDSIEAYEYVTRRRPHTEFINYKAELEYAKGLPRQHPLRFGFYELYETGDPKNPYRGREVNRKKYPERRATHRGSTRYTKIRPDVKRKFSTRTKFSVDDIEVEFVPVSHSIADANAQIVHTSDATIIYTGDMRMINRPYQEKSFDFLIKGMEQKPIDVLIADGTKINESKTMTEYDVKRQVDDIIKGTDGLILMASNYRDLYRLNTLKTAVEDNDRIFVTYPKAALYWAHMPLRRTFKRELNYSISTANKFYVYEKDSETKTRSYIYEKEENVSGFKQTPRKTIDTFKVIEEIEDEEIKSHPDRYAIHINTYNMGKITDFQPPVGSKFIFSKSEAFDEETELEDEKIINWCEAFGMPHYHAHCSGHYPRQDFEMMVELFDPKILLPIHCSRENALLMKEMFPDKTKILEVGEEFKVKTGLLNYF